MSNNHVKPNQTQPTANIPATKDNTGEAQQATKNEIELN